MVGISDDDSALFSDESVVAAVERVSRPKLDSSLVSALSVVENKVTLDSDDVVAKVSDSDNVEVGFESVLSSERELKVDKVAGESVLEFSGVVSVDSEETDSSRSPKELVESSDMIADVLETSFPNESIDEAMSLEEMKEFSDIIKVVCVLG